MKEQTFYAVQELHGTEWKDLEGAYYWDEHELYADSNEWLNYPVGIRKPRRVIKRTTETIIKDEEVVVSSSHGLWYYEEGKK